MSEHMALSVEQLVASAVGNGRGPPMSVAISRSSFSTLKGADAIGSRLSKQRSSSSLAPKQESKLYRTGSSCSTRDRDCCEVTPLAFEPLLIVEPSAECRICQEEDAVTNLESPCACIGSLKFAHHKCVQHWCNEKGNIICEICHKPYEGGYTISASPSAASDNVSISIGGSWDNVSGRWIDLHNSRPFSVESEYEEYTRTNARSAIWFHWVALILMAILLLRHVVSTTNTAEKDDGLTFFMLFLLRVLGLFLPCYILARGFSLLTSRHRREEVAMAAAGVPYLLQNGQFRGVSIGVFSRAYE